MGLGNGMRVVPTARLFGVFRVRAQVLDTPQIGLGARALFLAGDDFYVAGIGRVAVRVVAC